MAIRNTWTFGIVCVLAASIGGCYRHTWVVGKGGNTEAEPNKSYWQAHWIGGLIGGSQEDVARVCPSGNATLKDNMSFLNSLVSSLLLGIYSPTTVEIYCGDGKTASLVLDGDAVRKVALAPSTLEWARRVSPEKAADMQAAIEAQLRASTLPARGMASDRAPSSF